MSFDAHIGDYGRAIRRTLSIGGVPVNLTGCTIVGARVLKPTANEVSWVGGAFEVAGASLGLVDITPLNDTYLDGEGEWTLYVSVQDADGVFSADPVTILVGPRGVVTPGSVTAASTATGLEAQAAYLSGIATEIAPQTIRFLRNVVYTLDATVNLVGLANLFFEFEPGARVTASFSGGADLATNALFSLEPIVYAPTTTLLTTRRKGSYALTLAVGGAAAAGIVAGSWVRITGSNNADASPGDSDAASISIDEIIRVLSVAGDVLTLYSATRQHHALGKTVTRILPCRNITFRGDGLLDCAGGTVAVGIRCLTADRVSIEGLRFRGFSKSAVLMQTGTRRSRTLGCRSLGENNGLHHEYSAHDCEAIGWTCDPEGARYHASGLIRGALRSQMGCTGGTWAHNRIQKMCFGFMDFGSKNAERLDNRWDDLDPTEAIVRMEADLTEWDSGQPAAVGYWIGIGKLALAEYSQHLVVNGLHGEQTVTPVSAGRHFQADFHDARYTRIINVTLANRGGIADMDGGLRVHDTFECEGLNWSVRGIRRAIIIQNDPSNTRVTNIRLDASAGDGLVATAMYLNQASSRGLEFADVHFVNYATQYSQFDWGPDFLLAAMFGIELRDFSGDPYSGSTAPPIGRMTMARYTAGGPLATAEMATLSGGAGDRIVTRIAAAGPNQAPVVAGENLSAGYCWVQDPSRNCLVIADGSAPVVCGSKLEGVLTSGLGCVKVNAAVSLANCCGRAGIGLGATIALLPTMGF